MSRFQRMARFAIVLAWLAGILGWQGLVVTGGPASAATAKWPSVDCHVSSHPSGTWVAICRRSSTSTTTCSLIPLPGTPAGYLRRWPAPHGQRWAAIDCPGRYPFGGVTLMPGSHR
jgi:hypothetical protein